jgi:hypothetical protein
MRRWLVGAALGVAVASVVGLMIFQRKTLERLNRDCAKAEAELARLDPVLARLTELQQLRWIARNSPSSNASAAPPPMFLIGDSPERPQSFLDYPRAIRERRGWLDEANAVIAIGTHAGGRLPQIEREISDFSKPAPAAR